MRSSNAQRAGAVLLALAAFAVPALAQEETPEPIDTVPVRDTGPRQAAAPAREAPTELDTVEVTGSRILRSNYETAQPIQIITRQDIDKSGITSIGELLERLPYAGSGGLNTAVNNGGNGSELLDLRYLGPQRVLVLVNGRRWVGRLEAFGGSGGVDLTTIPIAVVERVEVLKDGASAVYGTDAIAGVVNLITRKDYAGAELGVQLATYDFDEGEKTQTYNLTWGQVGSDNSVFVNLQYFEQDPVHAGDREISQNASPGTGVLFFGSSSTPQGRFRFTPPPGGVRPNGCPPAAPPTDPVACDVTPTPGTDGQAPTNFRQFAATDRYNFGPVNYLLTPSERTSIFTQARHTVFDDVDFTTELLYSLRQSVQQLAEVPLNGGNTSTSGPTARSIYIDSTNPYNDFGYDIGRDDGSPDHATATTAKGQFFRRMTEVGPRIFSQNVDTYHVSSAFDGDVDLFDKFVRWEVGGMYSQSRLAETNANLVNLEHARLALGPLADCEATLGCVPLNVLGGQGAGTPTITPAMIEYIAYNGAGTAKQALREVFAHTSLPIFRLPGGDAAIGLGIEVRSESFTKQPDPLVATGVSSTNREEPTSGNLTAEEGYVELALPLVSDAFLAKTVELSLATRYSDYSRFDAATSSKAALKYQPFDDLMLRGSWSEAFRAPSIGELFQGLADNFPAVNDPCSDDEDQTAQQQANCDADDVPTAYTQANSQILSPRGGNPDLVPETADSLTGGFIYNPGFLDGLDVVVDWFHYRLDKGISVLGAQSILDRCYDNAQRDATACSRVARAASGDIQQVLDAYLNLNEIEVEGMDLGLRYRLDNWAYGTDWTYLTRYAETSTDLAGNPVTIESQGQAAGLASNGISYPRLKGNVQVDWTGGQWKALGRVRAIKNMLDSCAVPGLVGMPELCTDGANGLNEIDWTYYLDLQAGYDFADNLELVFGADNVLDQDPPPNYDTSSPGFDTLTYDIPGIAAYLRLRKQF